MNVTKVNIVADRYFHKFKLPNTSIARIETNKTDYDALSSKETPLPVFSNATYLSSANEICFDTTSGYLSDKEYATQASGFHWVKITGYEMWKVYPEDIHNDNLSNAAVKIIKENAVPE